MKQPIRFAAALLAALAITLTGCGSDDEAPVNTPDAGSAATGTYNRYVNNSLKIGATTAEAAALGFVDLDGKGDPRDNFLGKLLAMFNSLLALDGALTTAINEGSIILLHSVRADDISNDTSVSWQVWLGNPQPMPKFDGTGQFTVASNAPRDAIVTGAIAAGKFTGKATALVLELTLVEGSAPLRIKVSPAHIEGNVTTSSITAGRIAGAISAQEINDNILPAVATILDARIGADAGCRQNVADCESSNQTILTAFDLSPKDGTITVAEVRGSVLAQLLAPDVDVLLANGQPGQDGTNDSVSIALGFGGVKATFTAPTE